MVHLIIDLKQNLIQRKMNEMRKMENLHTEEDKNLLLVSSGKIIELDFLIQSLNDMIDYIDKSEKIYQ